MITYSFGGTAAGPGGSGGNSSPTSGRYVDPTKEQVESVLNRHFSGPRADKNFSIQKIFVPDQSVAQGGPCNGGNSNAASGPNTPDEGPFNRSVARGSVSSGASHGYNTSATGTGTGPSFPAGPPSP